MSASRTLRACYLGITVLALVANLAPPLFIPLRAAFDLTFEQLGRMVFLGFVTLLIFNLLPGPFVDRWGAKPFLLAAQVVTLIGLVVFAFPDRLFPSSPYTGLVCGAVLLSMGAGILELVLSPLVSTVSTERKSASMSLLHAFYAIGQFSVVLVTALAIWLGAPWRVIVLSWSLLPLAALIAFASVEIPRLVAEEHRQKLRHLVRKPVYLAAVAGIMLAGASEMAVSQWISTYAEKGLHVPKIVGDLGGLCAFAVMLGAARLWMGLQTTGTDLMNRALPISCVVTMVAYLTATLAPVPWIALPACAFAGIGIGLLWPGMLVITLRHFPRGGASMFALLTSAGNLGCALAPWVVGMVADGVAAMPQAPPFMERFDIHLTPEQLGLRSGMLVAVIAPVALFFLVRRLIALAPSSVPSDGQPR